MRVFFLAAMMLCFSLRAEEMDKYAQQALSQTMDLLRSPEKREEEIKKDKKAQEAHERVQSITGNPESTQKLYELSALVMKSVTEKAGGDPDKMMKLIEQAQKDPAGFAKTFTPEQQKLLKELAEVIEASKPSKSVP